MGRTIAVTNCRIIDGGPESTILSGMTIIYKEGNSDPDDGCITAIGKTDNTELSGVDEIIDLENRYVIPGLINAHSHLFSDGSPRKFISNEKTRHRLTRFLSTSLGAVVLRKISRANAVAALNAGITTIRCLGGVFYSDVEIRDDIEQGRFKGPRMLTSGPIISVTGGHGTPSIAVECDSPWEGRRCVRKHVKARVDLIKIAVTGGVTDAERLGDAGRLAMTEEEITAICEEAHKIGLLVAAHAESIEGVRIALRGGVDTIEHGSEMDEEIVNLFKHNPKSLRGYSALIPTLHAAIPLAVFDMEITGVTRVVRENTRLVLERMIRGIHCAIEAGIAVGMGTDASVAFVPHYGAWRELDYMEKFAGVKPATALHFATGSNAKILGIDSQTGTVAVGKSADFLVLHDNPFENLRILSTPDMVVFRGEKIDTHRGKKLKPLDDYLDTISVPLETYPDMESDYVDA